jgi:putative SOS response-associated peptidase YedK
VATKPAFLRAFRERRRLMLADGFYEWQRQDARKQPFYIRLREGRPFAFAGLWERWMPQDGQPIDSCTIITTVANGLDAALRGGNRASRTGRGRAQCGPGRLVVIDSRE